MNFKIKNSEIKFQGKVFDLKVDDIVYDRGNEGIREVAVHPGGAVVVPVKDNNKIILLRPNKIPSIFHFLNKFMAFLGYLTSQRAFFAEI